MLELLMILGKFGKMQTINDINSNTGNALSLVSDDAKQKIEQLLNRNKADKDHIVVVNKSQLTSQLIEINENKASSFYS